MCDHLGEAGKAEERKKKDWETIGNKNEGRSNVWRTFSEPENRTTPVPSRKPPIRNYPPSHTPTRLAMFLWPFPSLGPLITSTSSWTEPSSLLAPRTATQPQLFHVPMHKGSHTLLLSPLPLPRWPWRSCAPVVSFQNGRQKTDSPHFTWSWGYIKATEISGLSRWCGRAEPSPSLACQTFKTWK